MNYLDKRDNCDIIEKIRRRYFVKGIACAFLSLGVLIFFHLYAYAYFVDRLGAVNGVIACILGMALPFFLLKLHRDIFDRSWEGVITGLKNTQQTLKCLLLPPRTALFTWSRRFLRKVHCRMQCSKLKKIWWQSQRK